PVGHGAVPAARAGEQQGARPAGAGDRAVLRVDQVSVPAAHAVRAGERLAAQLAALLVLGTRPDRRRGEPAPAAPPPGPTRGARAAPARGGGGVRGGTAESVRDNCHGAPAGRRRVICSSGGSRGTSLPPVVSGAASATACSMAVVVDPQPLPSRTCATPASST